MTDGSILFFLKKMTGSWLDFFSKIEEQNKKIIFIMGYLNVYCITSINVLSFTFTRCNAKLQRVIQKKIILSSDKKTQYHTKNLNNIINDARDVEFLMTLFGVHCLKPRHIFFNKIYAHGVL